MSYSQVINQPMGALFRLSNPLPDKTSILDSLCYAVTVPLSPGIRGLCIIDSVWNDLEVMDDLALLALLDLIRRAICREKTLSDSAFSYLPCPKLNSMEKQIIEGVCKGKTNKNIAEACGLELRKVKTLLNELVQRFEIDISIKHKRPVLAAQARLAEKNPGFWINPVLDEQIKLIDKKTVRLSCPGTEQCKNRRLLKQV